ncbi:RNA polymerase sigma-70 factor [Flammeovirgaceae bacterium SG7u.111]|nr:RNA polymerase sigma-70 factor [Flammeovirgaceae bacterium SG7u.132]WPO36868.1 RNA polymerase sigma-70 factor [Flammeovirgaceae bacterium SG7u.111]
MSKNKPHYSEEVLKKLIAKGDEAAFEFLFKSHYTELCRHSLRYVQSEPIAEELVHDTFMSIWQSRKKLNVKGSFQNYLFVAVKNRSLNYLKSRYAKQTSSTDFDLTVHPSAEATADELTHKELEKIIAAGVDKLPEKCRIIFQLRQNTEMNYEQIGKELGISKKTVAAQMKIALDKLQVHIEKNWGSFVWLLVWGKLLG